MALLKKMVQNPHEPDKNPQDRQGKKKPDMPDSGAETTGFESVRRAENLEISRDELELFAHRGDFRSDWSDNADDFDGNDWTAISTEEHGFIGTCSGTGEFETEDINPDDEIPINTGWQSVLDPIPDGRGKGRRRT